MKKLDMDCQSGGFVLGDENFESRVALSPAGEEGRKD
jgi:hypothetical protein